MARTNLHGKSGKRPAKSGTPPYRKYEKRPHDYSAVYASNPHLRHHIWNHRVAQGNTRDGTQLG